MNILRKTLSLCTISLLLAACGGGGSGGGTGAPTAKSATVAFSITSTATLPTAVNGVNLTASLPAGTTVATDAGSNNISSSALTIGSGLNDPNRLVFGTYSAAANKVKIFIVIPGSTTFRGGEIAKLSVSYPATGTLTASDFSSLNSPSFPLFEAAGFDEGSSTVFDLSGKLQASLGVTFN